MQHTLAVRRSDMLPVRMIRLTFWGGECTTVRWAFGCPDTVLLVNTWLYVINRVPWVAQILVCRWIDANDHMYIENLAVD